MLTEAVKELEEADEIKRKADKLQKAINTLQNTVDKIQAPNMRVSTWMLQYGGYTHSNSICNYMTKARRALGRYSYPGDQIWIIAKLNNYSTGNTNTNVKETSISGYKTKILKYRRRKSSSLLAGLTWNSAWRSAIKIEILHIFKTHS